MLCKIFRTIRLCGQGQKYSETDPGRPEEERTDICRKEQRHPDTGVCTGRSERSAWKRSLTVKIRRQH